MAKLYSFNNRANQHNILLVHTALGNRIYESTDIAEKTRLICELDRLDAMCEKHGIFCTPHSIKMPYEDWCYFNEISDSAKFYRAMNCDYAGIEYVE